MFVNLPVDDGFFERKREIQCCFSKKKSKNKSKNKSNKANEDSKNNKYPNCHVWEFHIIELMRSKLSDNRTN